MKKNEQSPPGREARFRWNCFLKVLVLPIVITFIAFTVHSANTDQATHPYTNALTPIKNPQPLLADHPDWIEPIRETNRWEAAAVVNDPGADLDVRAWRW